MPLVEMVGANGVGKSTLAAALLAGEPEDGWKDLQSLVIDAARLEVPLPPPYPRLIEGKARWLAAQGAPPEVIARASETSVHRAWRDQMVRVESPELLLLSDEHVLQHFCGEVLDLAVQEPATARPFLDQRFVMYLQDSPDNILANLKARTAGDGALHEEAVVRDVTRFQQRLQEFGHVLHALGGTCIVLDMQQGLAACEAQARLFLADVKMLARSHFG